MLAGALLRMLYTWGTDVRNVYDDHFRVARMMLEQHRWPHPDDGWQCYQPPLYHALSALTYSVFSGHAQGPPPPQPSYEERNSGAGIQCRYPWHLAGRRGGLAFRLPKSGLSPYARILRAPRSAVSPAGRPAQRGRSATAISDRPGSGSQRSSGRISGTNIS